MALKPLLLTLALSLVVACSNSGGGMLSVGTIFKSLAANKEAAAQKPVSQYSREDIASAGQPVLRVKVASMGIDGLMVEREKKGDIVSWTDGGGVTATFRNGVLIETRGFGADLMSSRAPSASQLAGSGTHTRSYFFAGAEDINERRDYTCHLATVGSETLVIYGRSHTTRHVTEICERPGARITNHFWFEGGKIRKSRQWVSPNLGSIESERVID